MMKCVVTWHHGQVPYSETVASRDDRERGRDLGGGGVQLINEKRSAKATLVLLLREVGNPQSKKGGGNLNK